MNAFKFELKQRVVYKEKGMIVVGKSQFVQHMNRYMCQEIEDFTEVGFKPVNSFWAEEHELKLLK